MRLGVTGTRQGMTEAQLSAFEALYRALQPREFHHGDCVGADAEAHHIARETVFNWGWVRIHVHAPINSEHRAWCRGDVEHAPLSHFARNRAIVDATDLLIGVSLTPHRTDRGGTWYTIDYAVKRGKPVRVIWPDGSVEDWPRV